MTDPKGNQTQISYTDGLELSSVTTTPMGNGGSQVGPSTVVDDNEQTGTITTTKVAAPSDGGGTMAKTVEHLDYAGRTVATDQYYDIAGGLFYTATQTFDSAGRPWQSTDNDPLSRVSKVEVGTSLGSGSSPGNLVPVKEIVFDNNNVGDGNVTQTADMTGAVTAPPLPAGVTSVGPIIGRVSQTAFDWRDRAAATQAGLVLNGSGAVVKDLLADHLPADRQPRPGHGHPGLRRDRPVGCQLRRRRQRHDRHRLSAKMLGRPAAGLVGAGEPAAEGDREAACAGQPVARLFSPLTW